MGSLVSKSLFIIAILFLWSQARAGEIGDNFAVNVYTTIASQDFSDGWAIEASWEFKTIYELDILYVHEQVCKCAEGPRQVRPVAGIGFMVYQDWFTNLIHPNLRLGIGLIKLSDTNILMGRTMNFNGKLVWQFNENLEVGWKHLSNAGTASPNRGQDLVGVTWRFK